MTAPAGEETVRLADVEDVEVLAALRRAWTEENGGDGAVDAGFEQRFADWYAQEAPHRVTWLAEVDRRAVGTLNLALFDRMPRPGVERPGWAYIANVFVLCAFRNRGLGTRLVDSAVSYAQSAGLDRLVLHPSERAVPLYRRAGFRTADMLLVRTFT